MQKNERKKVFFVTSRDLRRMDWLLKILNSHPDIHCTMGKDLRIMTSKKNGTVDEEPDQLQSLNEIIYGVDNNNNEAKIYGNIQGCPAPTVESKVLSETFTFPHVHVNIIRHPFVRIESFIHHCIRESLNDPFLQQEIEKFIEKSETIQTLKQIVLSRYKGVDFSYFPNQLFIYAITLMGEDLVDSKINCMHVKYEEISSDIECFISVFRYLTHNEIPLTNAFLKVFYEKEILDGAPFEPVSVNIAQKWEKWQVMLMQFCFKTNPRLIKFYENLNYEIKFIYDLVL